MKKSLIAFLALVFQVFCVKDDSFCMQHMDIRGVHIVSPGAIPYDSVRTLAEQPDNFFRNCPFFCGALHRPVYMTVPSATLIHSYNGIGGIGVAVYFSARIADPVRVGQICTFLGISPAQVPNDFSFTIARTEGMLDTDGNPLAMRFPWEYTNQYLANPGNCSDGYNVAASVALIDANGGMRNPNVSGGYSMHPTQEGCLTVSPNNGHLNVDPKISTAVISGATWTNGPIAGQTRLSIFVLLNEGDADNIFWNIVENTGTRVPIYSAPTYQDLLNALPAGLMNAQNSILKKVLE